MKHAKKLSALTAAAVGTSLLVLASVAQAATVIRDPGNDANALGISNLEVDLGFDVLLLNVEFLNEPASSVYGDPPTFDFGGGTAGTIRDGINEALNDAGDIQFTDGRPAYDIAFDFGVLGEGDFQVALVLTWEAARGDGVDDTWIGSAEPDVEVFNDPNVTYARISAVPIPAALPLFAAGFGALGLVGWRRKERTAEAV